MIVACNSSEQLRRTLPALVAELEADDELIVVDNASEDGSAQLALELAPSARVVEMGENAGFGAAVNAGAETARGDLLVVLNPDAMPRPGFREAIARPLADGRGWGAWMGLVTADDGRLLNSRGGVVHFTGVAWAGGAGEPLPESVEPGEVAFASGACMAVPIDTWRRTGGFAPGYFLYHEDVELSLRLRLAGERIGIEPSAVVDHDYEFGRTGDKLLLLERNRWATVLRTYPAPVLVVALPGLLATELALIVISMARGWWRLKLRALGQTLRSLPRTLSERRRVQAGRAIGAAEFAWHLSAELDSSFLGRASDSGVLRWCLRAYWRAATGLLRIGR